MAFSLFGKRDTPTPDPEPPEPSAPRGLFDRMKQAVTRTRESLSNSISSVVALTREVDEASLDDLELALLACDIGFATTNEIITRLRDRALRHGISDGAELKQQLKSEILRVLNSVDKPANQPAAPPEVIMMVGVNGTGKTTTTGKLAAYFTAQGRTVLLCAADTFRAAAIEQLEVWGERTGVQVIRQNTGSDPSAVMFDALSAAKARQTDYVIIDTAGRLQTKTNLMAELEKMRRTASRIIPDAPHEVLLVLDATTGQNGLEQARKFTESSGVTGIVLTKLDGTAKGGIILAIATELGLPVKFVGVGEKMEDILPFDSAAFVDSMVK